MTEPTIEELQKSKNSWAKLCKVFDNQRMQLHGVVLLAIKTLEQVKDLDTVHPDLSDVLRQLKAVRATVPQQLGDAMPAAFKGHGQLLDDLLQNAYYCSQISVGITDTIFFDEALEAIKQQMNNKD